MLRVIGIVVGMVGLTAFALEQGWGPVSTTATVAVWFLAGFGLAREARAELT